MSKIDLRGLDGREDEAVAAAKRVLGCPGGALVLGGHVIEQGDEIAASRVVTYVLRGAAIEESWPAWALLLMPPYTRDATVLLNTISAQRGVSTWSEPEARVIASLLPGFLQHCLQQAPLVAERAISFAVSAEPSVWLGATPDGRAALLAALDEAIRSVDEESLQSSWSEELAELRRELEESARQQPLEVPELQRRLRARSKKIEGERPREVAEELVERVDAYLSSGAEGRIKSVQKVYLRSHHRLTDEVWSVIRSWGQFSREVAARIYSVAVELEPANVATGSLRVDHVINTEGEDDSSKFLQAAERLNGALSGQPSDEDVGSLFRLLQALQGTHVSLEVRHYWGRIASPSATLSPRNIRKFRELAAARLTQRVDSIDVPQADTLEKVFQVVELSSRGREVTPEALEVVPRQVSYYRRAAKILGLLDDDNDVTPAGWQLARLPEKERWTAAVVLFEASACGSAWIGWSRGRNLLDLAPSSAEEFLTERVIGLSGHTITRRAQTLEAWRNALAPHHYATKK